MGTALHRLYWSIAQRHLLSFGVLLIVWGFRIWVNAFLQPSSFSFSEVNVRHISLSDIWLYLKVNNSFKRFREIYWQDEIEHPFWYIGTARFFFYTLAGNIKHLGFIPYTQYTVVLQLCTNVGTVHYTYICMYSCQLPDNVLTISVLLWMHPYFPDCFCLPYPTQGWIQNYLKETGILLYYQFINREVPSSKYLFLQNFLTKRGRVWLCLFLDSIDFLQLPIYT
jgi:hypothetical protein